MQLVICCTHIRYIRLTCPLVGRTTETALQELNLPLPLLANHTYQGSAGPRPLDLIW